MPLSKTQKAALRAQEEKELAELEKAIKANEKLRAAQAKKEEEKKQKEKLDQEKILQEEKCSQKNRIARISEVWGLIITKSPQFLTPTEKSIMDGVIQEIKTNLSKYYLPSDAFIEKGQEKEYKLRLAYVLSGLRAHKSIDQLSKQKISEVYRYCYTNNSQSLAQTPIKADLPDKIRAWARKNFAN